MGRADLNQILRLKNQPVIAAENLSREENLSPVLIPTLFKEMDEQPKVAHKVVDIQGRPYRKIEVTLLRYILDKPESS